MSTMEDLKQEAKELGINFSANIGEAKLKAKIDEYYESQETSGKEIQEIVEKTEEKSEEKSAVSGKRSPYERAKIAEANARKTKIITIIDNDQRVNNQTTTCTVSCGNEFFDLGQMRLPLNMPVEVMQGHINVLKEVKIPQHIKDGKSGLSTVVLRPRYTISYEEQ
jgi:PIN domain nuclease of toxin-antitoxin system